MIKKSTRTRPGCKKTSSSWHHFGLYILWGSHVCASPGSFLLLLYTESVFKIFQLWTLHGVELNMGKLSLMSNTSLSRKVLLQCVLSFAYATSYSAGFLLFACPPPFFTFSQRERKERKFFLIMISPEVRYKFRTRVLILLIVIKWAFPPYLSFSLIKKKKCVYLYY